MKKVNALQLRFLLILGCISGLLPTYAQPLQLPYQSYSLEEGLTDRVITDILLHRSGFLWIGTPTGLNRFDGYTFQKYTDEPGRKPALSRMAIDRLYEDRHQRLVILYEHNFTLFDLLYPERDEIERVDLLPGRGVRGNARDVALDRSGRIFVASISEEGTHIFQYDQNLEEKLFLQESRKLVTSDLDLLPLSDSSFLINDDEKGLRWFSPEGELLQTFSKADFDTLPPGSNFHRRINFLYEDSLKRVWMSTSKPERLFLLDTLSRQWRWFPPLNNGRPIRRVWEDESANLLFGIGHGVGEPPQFERLLCLQSNGQLADLSYLLSGADGLSAVRAKSFFSNVFMGTGQGMISIQNNRSKISALLSQPQGNPGLRHDIRGICQNPTGQVFFNTLQGAWYRYDPGTEELDSLQLRQAGRDAPSEPFCGGPMILDRSRDCIWSISCTDALSPGLYQLDPNTMESRRFGFYHALADLSLDERGRLWVVAEEGYNRGLLLQFDPSTGSFLEFFDEMDQNPLRRAKPYFVEASGDSLLWIGTNRGLLRIRMDERKADWMALHDEVMATRDYQVFTMHAQGDSLLWLGTNNGLIAYVPGKGVLVEFNRQQGLPHEKVFGILPAENDNLWVSTYYGLSYYDQAKQLFRNFFREDGLTSNEFSPNTCLKGNGESYFFGSPNGLNVFSDSDLLVDAPTPKVVLTKVVRYNPQKGGLITRTTNLSDLDRLTISPNDTYFQLHFMLPLYDRPIKNQFKIKLEGYDKDWNYLGNTPIANYTKLPSGRYTLRVKGAPPNGVWSQDALRVEIKVRQIWYRTWWFLILAALTIIGGIYLILRRQLEQRLKVERLRTKLSSDLHDEMSGLLSGIAMQTDILQMQVKEDIVQERLRRIGEVSRKAMAKMNDVIWSIDSRKDKMENLIERMREHADDILMPVNVHYNLELHRVDPSVKIPFEIRQELYFIYKEAINNVAKHSNASEVAIVLENSGKEFVLTVADNGTGHPNTKSVGKGQGLNNLQMRAQRIGADLSIQNGHGFTIQLRMRRFT